MWVTEKRTYQLVRCHGNTEEITALPNTVPSLALPSSLLLFRKVEACNHVAAWQMSLSWMLFRKALDVATVPTECPFKDSGTGPFANWYANMIVFTSLICIMMWAACPFLVPGCLTFGTVWFLRHRMPGLYKNPACEVAPVVEDGTNVGSSKGLLM